MPAQRPRNIRVPAREIPQLPFVRCLRLAVDEIVRDVREVQEERDGVDEKGCRD